MGPVGSCNTGAEKGAGKHIACMGNVVTNGHSHGELDSTTPDADTEGREDEGSYCTVKEDRKDVKDGGKEEQGGAICVDRIFLTIVVSRKEDIM